LKRNRISVGALKALDLEVSIRDGVLKITRDSMMILKGVRRNKIYYLNGSDREKVEHMKNNVLILGVEDGALVSSILWQ